MPARRFKAVITEMGPSGAWSCIRVPFDVEPAFGSRARVAVRVTLNGAAFRSSIFPDGRGSHFMMVNKRMRNEAKADTGDTVAVTMEPDTAARTVALPRDFRAALARDRAAAAAFAALAHSHRKEYVEWIVEAKRAETRAARITKALKMVVERRRVK